MSNINDSLKSIRQIPGCSGAAIVNVRSGMSLAQFGKQKQMLDVAKMSEAIEELVLTSRSHYHMIYPKKVSFLKVKEPEHLFFFAALEKRGSLLVQARSRMSEIVDGFTM